MNSPVCPALPRTKPLKLTHSEQIDTIVLIDNNCIKCADIRRKPNYKINFNKKSILNFLKKKQVNKQIK